MGSKRKLDQIEDDEDLFDFVDQTMSKVPRIADESGMLNKENDDSRFLPSLSCR